MPPSTPQFSSYNDDDDEGKKMDDSALLTPPTPLLTRLVAVSRLLYSRPSPVALAHTPPVSHLPPRPYVRIV